MPPKKQEFEQGVSRIQGISRVQGISTFTKYKQSLQTQEKGKLPPIKQVHNIYKRYLQGGKTTMLSKPVRSLNVCEKRLTGKTLPNSSALLPFSRKLKPKRFKPT